MANKKNLGVDNKRAVSAAINEMAEEKFEPSWQQEADEENALGRERRRLGLSFDSEDFELI